MDNSTEKNIEEMENISTNEVEENQEIEEMENTEPTEKVEEKNERLFTQEEINKIISDRAKRITAKERSRYEKLLNKQNLEADLIEREKAVTIKENKFNVVLQLQAEGLPLELANHVDYTNNKTIEKSYEGIKKIFTDGLQKGIEKAVSERLKGNAPKANQSQHNYLDTKIKEIFKR